MNGQVDSYLNGRAALEQLEARFGTGPAAQLMKAWQDSWFTAADLDLIKSWGFNCIRVPFSWRNLQDAAGNWILDPSGNIDFSRFDWVVTEAGNRGIYVILDFHYWPRQAEPNNYGLPSRWTTDGGIVRQQMAAIWTEIAKHFRGDPRVAGFDVINEPEGSPWNAPHNAFEDAIKAQDPDRLIIVEWSGYNNTLAEFGNNSMYSDHYSFDDEASFQGYKASIDAGPNRVPLFLGEMKAGNDTAPGARWMADTMNAQNWHWCIWTYKGVSVGGWAAFNYYTQLRYNLSSDPFESIMDKWSRGLVQWQNASAPANSYKTQWWIDGFRQN
ncbi:glycoside hydrolase superfamily [Hyaloraphidium curvatum]|nr:glycoside hydrolase superfamily [Hyaloraphidium curvatum]